jgi:hypothetical protein
VVIRKPLDLPPAVTHAFVEDMKAFFAAKQDRYKQEEIAARQLHASRQHKGSREKALRLTDVKAMFLEMRDQI